MQAQRLKTRSQFQAVLACAASARTEHFVMHRMDLPSSEAALQAAAQGQLFAPASLWIGAMVPKRWARRAVTRNLIKRQIYSMAAEKLVDAGSAAYLVRLRTGYDRQHFKSAASDALRAAVRREIEQLFMRAARTSGAQA